MFDYLTKQLEILDQELEKAKKHLNSIEEFKLLVYRQRQQVCEHKNTYTLEDLDYHNNVSFTETHCKDCGAYVSKK